MDNALLIILIAQLVEKGQAAWYIPAIKLVFTIAYVVLAPWVGGLADRWPKKWVMLGANGIKASACLGVLLGVDSMLAYCVAGVGAALYSPAKYGLVTELEPARRLVAANAWIEISTVGAIICGTMLGGFWVSSAWRQWGLVHIDFLSSLIYLAPSVFAVFIGYGVAAGLNLFIPYSGQRYLLTRVSMASTLGNFYRNLRRLWSDPLGGVSVAVTTLFWGVGATMQLLVLVWAQQGLGLGLDQAAYLQGCVAVGVVLGAALASRYVALHQSLQVIKLGVLMGLLLPIMNHVHDWRLAAVLMIFVGLLSGLFIVPMNALLQQRGKILMTPGESIAIQNFSENLSVLLMMSAYTLMLMNGYSTRQLVWLLAAWIVVCMSATIAAHTRRSGRDSEAMTPNSSSS